nr:unnamed protein product [Callosobruchus chinensis]
MTLKMSNDPQHQKPLKRWKKRKKWLCMIAETQSEKFDLKNTPGSVEKHNSWLFLCSNNSIMMPQAPYSPDMTPCDFLRGVSWIVKSAGTSAYLIGTFLKATKLM